MIKIYSRVMTVRRAIFDVVKSAVCSCWVAVVAAAVVKVVVVWQPIHCFFFQILDTWRSWPIPNKTLRSRSKVFASNKIRKTKRRAKKFNLLITCSVIVLGVLLLLSYKDVGLEVQLYKKNGWTLAPP